MPVLLTLFHEVRGLAEKSKPAPRKPVGYGTLNRNLVLHPRRSQRYGPFDDHAGIPPIGMTVCDGENQNIDAISLRLIECLRGLRVD